ncbi:suppressor of cytokine signaling 7-like [Stylophora pistillata]|uniref:suppressor of cytokine signaling 7-like n=1 Tax=Stylophora pistillata TaxID=50429 RepID=UPI000C03A5E1|nr:suppressor of cytokine signaling 7-like [Stylophora pistillata]
MDESEREGEEQVYDFIGNASDENSNEIEGVERTSAGEESLETGTDEVDQGLAASPTEDTVVEKKNILLKLREKFRRRRLSEDSLGEHFDSEETNESLAAYSSIEDDELPTTTKRLSLKHKTLSFPGFAKDRYFNTTGAKRSRSKSFSFRMQSKEMKAKRKEDMFARNKQAGDTCSTSTWLHCEAAQGDPHIELAQKRAVPPPPPPRSVKSQFTRIKHRQIVKSLTLSLDELDPCSGGVQGVPTIEGVEKQLNAKCQQTATKTNCQQYSVPLTKSLESLSHYSWYWGPIDQFEAEVFLQDKPDGCFLVRDSFHEFHLYSVSYRCRGRTCHTRIRFRNGIFYFVAPPDETGTKTVVGLIKKSMKMSLKGPMCFSKASSFLGFPTFPIRLTTPVSRFEELPSLQHLCRFVIRQNSRCDKLHELPLPSKIIKYLNVENHFLENEGKKNSSLL